MCHFPPDRLHKCEPVKRNMCIVILGYRKRRLKPKPSLLTSPTSNCASPANRDSVQAHLDINVYFLIQFQYRILCSDFSSCARRCLQQRVPVAEQGEEGATRVSTELKPVGCYFCSRVHFPCGCHGNWSSFPQPHHTLICLLPLPGVLTSPSPSFLYQIYVSSAPRILTFVLLKLG